MTTVLLIATALTAGVVAAYWRWRERQRADIAEAAADAWAGLRTRDPALLEGLSETRFGEIFARVHFPRAPLYILLMLATIVALTYPFLAALALVYNIYLWLGGAYPGPWVLGFSLFFGLIACWAGVAYVFAREYHRRAPGELRDEIIRNR